MSLRIGGIAAIVGGPLWVGAFAIARGSDGFGGVSAALMVTGSLALLWSALSA